MKKINTVDDYMASLDNFSSPLFRLRTLLNSTELEETIKWRAPTYCIDGKNVIGLAAFKGHFAIWFHNGVFLKDPNNLLINAQDGKTKALRQMRFHSEADIDDKVVLQYVNEAIANQKAGKTMPINRTKKVIIIPKELNAIFSNNKELKSSFNDLTPGKQREYCEYISSAKREVTKQTRIDKITPMIIKGVGLHDKYKNC